MKSEVNVGQACLDINSELNVIIFMQKRGILERLDAGEVVVGDGGFLYCTGETRIC